MDIVNILALSMGLAWASGINLYAAVFMLGYMGMTGHIVLPADLEVLSDPIVMSAAALMYMIEFVADKTPGVDTGWDAIHSFIRIPAGAVLAAGAVGDVSVAAEFAAFLIGGGLAAGSHMMKAGSRVMINTSPEPVSNWTVSIGEDVLVIAGIWTALNHPVLFLVFLLFFILLMVWLIPRLWRGVKLVFSKLRGWFSGRTKQLPAPLDRNSAEHKGKI